MRNWLLIFFLLFSPAVWSQEESDLRQLYMQAESEYSIGRFEASIRLLDSRISRFEGALRVSAYRLMSLCCLALDRRAEAERYASLLLREDPYYTVTIHDPVRFADMIGRLKRGEEATITTASQQAESVEEAPVPVTLITEEMIKASGARTLADLLTLYVPGMTMVDGHEMNVAMHGVYTSSQEKILIMLDGHRLNSHTTNSEAPDYRTSLDKIKQIEVLRGPASSLYGNVALTAVVNIITKKGYEADGVRLSAGFGNNRTCRFDFLMGKSGLNLDFLAWASVYSSQGEKRNIGIGDEEFYRNVLEPGVMYIDGYNHQPAYDIGFTVKWNELRFMYNTQYSKKVPTYSTILYQGLYSYDRYSTVNGSKPGHARQATHMDLSYEKNFGKKWNGKISVYLDMENCSHYDIGGDSILPGEGNTPIRPGDMIIDVSEVNVTAGLFQVLSWNDYSYGISMQSNYNFRNKFWNGTLLLGSQLENYVMKDNSMFLGDQFDRVFVTFSNKNRAINVDDELSFSAFSQLKAYLGERFILNGGLRYDYKSRYNGNKSNVISPRLSFMYDFKKGMNLKLGYSHSFVDAPYLYRGATIPTYEGGEKLTAEKMDALQLTFNHSIPTHNFKYEFNFYYNRLSNLIYYNTVEQSYKNAGGVNVTGLEGVFSYDAGRSMAYLNVAYQWLLNNMNYSAKGKYINNVPNLKINALYRYQILKSERIGNVYARMNVSILSKQKSPILGANIGAERYVDFDNELPSRAVFNIGFDYDYRKISASASVYNLLNADYYQGGASTTYMPWPQQSINFLIRLSYKF